MKQPTRKWPIEKNVNMTSAFELLVMGKQITFMIIRYAITVYASLELSFSVPPKKVTSPHSEVISSVWKVYLNNS